MARACITYLTGLPIDDTLFGDAFYNGCVYKERLLAGILVAGKTKLAF